MGTVLLGIATPTEAAAIAVLGALSVALIFKSLSFSLIKKSVYGTMTVSGMVLLIMAAASHFQSTLRSFRCIKRARGNYKRH